MFGRRHLIVTLWLQERVNSVDFRFRMPQFIQMDLLDINGMIHIIEALVDLKSSTLVANDPDALV